MSAADYIFGIAVIVVITASLYFGPRIKRDRIAMQWGFDGRPTWEAPKWFSLWAMVPLMLAVRLLIWLSATYAPRSTHHLELGIVVFSVIACAAHIFILKKAQRANASSVRQADGN